MKLSISVLHQQDCGGWVNVLYKIIDSTNDDNYQNIKKELIKNLGLKINKREKRIRKTHSLMNMQEFIDKGNCIIQYIIKEASIDKKSKIEITINEWFD